MKNGLITTMIGAAAYLAAAALLPWQRFELAQVAPTSLALGPLAWALVVVAAAVLATSIWGLASGRHVAAARVLLGASLAVAVGLVVAQGHRTWGLDLMLHETIVMDQGFVAALLALLVMFVGAASAVARAPTWDEATPVVRVRAVLRDGAAREVVVYEPRDVQLAAELGLPALSSLTARLTAEAAILMTVPRATRVAIAGRGARGKHGRIRLATGDSAVVGLEGLDLHVDFVRQARQAERRLVRGSEAVALALGALLVFLATGVATVLSSTEEPLRILPDADRRNATIAALTKEERRDDAGPVTVETAIVERTTAKAAGGDEGRFGDPMAPPERPTKVPPRDGRLVDRLDPKQVGLLEVVTDPRIDRALADVLQDDGAFRAKLAAATAGTDDGWSLGPGANGLSIVGDGDGGPGDGTGRLLAQSSVDTGPGSSTVAVALGPRERRKVPRVDMPAPAVAGDFCKRGDIESVVRRRASAIRACYEQRLQTNDDLKGKLTVRWTIGTDGKVTAADATVDTLGDPATSQCVTRAVRNMRFPVPDGGGFCVVQWPFVFNPG